MPQVLQTPLARQDLAEISRYIAQESKNCVIALRFLDQIGARCELYAGQPRMGERCPDLGDRVRQLRRGELRRLLPADCRRHRGTARAARQPRCPLCLERPSSQLIPRFSHALTGAYASISWSTLDGSTPVKRWSRPWNWNVNRW